MTTSLSVIIVLITFAFLIAWIVVEVLRFNKQKEITKILNSSKIPDEPVSEAKSNNHMNKMVLFLLVALLFSSCASSRMFPNASHYSNSGRGFVPPCRRF